MTSIHAPVPFPLCRALVLASVVIAAVACGDPDATADSGVDVAAGDDAGTSDATSQAGDGTATNDVNVDVKAVPDGAGLDASTGGADGQPSDVSTTADATKDASADSTGDVTSDDAGCQGADLTTDSASWDVADASGMDGASDGDAILDDGSIGDSAFDSSVADGGSPDGQSSGDGQAQGQVDAGDIDAASTGDSKAANDTAVDAGVKPSCNPKNVGPSDPAKLPKAALVDITKKLGIDASKSYGLCAQTADLNNDGNADITVLELSPFKARVHALLLVDGKPKHVYTDVNTTLHYPNMGCAMFDLTDDGNADLLLGGSSGIGVYAGDGKGGFTDKTSDYMPQLMDFASWSMAPADLDGDGDLDIFVGAGPPPGTPISGGPPCKAYSCGYSGPEFACKFFAKPKPHESFQDRVLIRGKKLPMVDATNDWKVPADGIASNAAVMDMDGDGKPDILIGDDFGEHRVLKNSGKSFTAWGMKVGFHKYAHAMGWGFGDFNHDGKADVVLADLGPTPVYVNRKPAKGQPFAFEDCGGAMGVWSPTWGSSGWSPAVGDFDQDGDEDMLVGASITAKPIDLGGLVSSCADPTPKPNIDVLFIAGPMPPKTAGKPAGLPKFTPFRLDSGPGAELGMLTQQLADIDGDGDLDVVQVRPAKMGGHTVRILRNDVVKKGKSVTIRVAGKKGNMDALGTTVRAKVDGKLRIRWLNGSGGYGGTTMGWAHFGLGKATKLTDVEITWPDGKKTKVGDVGPTAKKVVKWP